MQRLQPLQNEQFGSKIKNAKNMEKTLLQEQQSCSVQKTARKNTKSFSSYNGYSLCKMVSLGQKLQMPKTCKQPFYKNSRVVLCKKWLQKTPNIGEMRYCENRPSCKGYSPCKGYILCKMVSLGQKLKMPKTCENPFYNNSTVVLCKKRLEKTPNIREMRHFSKTAIFQRP